MMISLAFLGVIMAAVIAWLLRQTINTQPWVAEAAEQDTGETGDPDMNHSRRLGLFAFLAVVTSFFALFFSAYSMRMNLPDWDPLREPAILWFNTALLVASSVAMQMATMAARRGQRARLRLGLSAGGVLAFGFLLGQLLAWQQLIAAGYYLQTNAANAFFYLFTGLHGLHVLGGLWVLGNATIAAFQTGAETIFVRRTTELCTIYWHFLLVVWLVLYWLMLTT